MSTRFSCFLLAIGIMKKMCIYKNDLFLQVLICCLPFPVRLVFPALTVETAVLLGKGMY